MRIPTFRLPRMFFLCAAIVLSGAITLAMALPAERPAEQPGATLAFVDVTVVPMDHERLLPGHTVLVQDGRITAVGPNADIAVPAGATRINGTGRYLMPGLAEMHGHIPGPENRQYVDDVMFLYVSNGVTLVRGMAGHPSHLDLREEIRRGELIGPTLFVAGPGFGGHNADTPEAAERLVREQHQAGYDLLKIWEMPRAAYDRMAETAHAVGIPFAGHIPSGVSLVRALEARQASIDHFDRYVEHLAGDAREGLQAGFFGSGIVHLADRDGIPAIAERTREAGVWNVPTLSLVEHLSSPEPPEQMIQWHEMRYMPQSVRDAWVRAKHDYQARPYFQPEAAQALVDLRRQLLLALHRAGALIALGSDAPQFFNVPGFSIHHEMEMMVGSGLTPYEVLATGTRAAAEYFGTPEEFGTVEVGRRADLILLDANPLENIANVRHRAGVVMRGQWLSEQEIQRRLGEIAARNAGGGE
jgi:imidazolonepropionase-like amidohydrolase